MGGSQEMNLWGMQVANWKLAIVTCCFASLLSVIGFVLQKRALNTPVAPGKRPWPQVGDIVLSPTWLLGLFLASVAPIPGDLLAYSLAPLSLTAPLSGVTVVLNTIAAPALLGERLQPWPDLVATGFILVGTVVTTSAGVHKDGHVVEAGNLDALIYHCADWTLLAAFVVLAAVLAGASAYMLKHAEAIEVDAVLRYANPRLEDVALPAVIAAGAGCITNIWLKVLGELMKAHASASDCLYCFFLGVLPFAFLQLLFVNRGLRLYLQTIFFPIYNALLVLSNTVYGALFFNEYPALLHHPERLLMFSSGVAAVVLGITTFRLRRPEAEGRLQLPDVVCRGTEDDKRQGLLLNASMPIGDELPPAVADDLQAPPAECSSYSTSEIETPRCASSAASGSTSPSGRSTPAKFSFDLRLPEARRREDGCKVPPDVLFNALGCRIDAAAATDMIGEDPSSLLGLEAV